MDLRQDRSIDTCRRSPWCVVRARTATYSGRYDVLSFPQTRQVRGPLHCLGRGAAAPHPASHMLGYYNEIKTHRSAGFSPRSRIGSINSHPIRLAEFIGNIEAEVRNCSASVADVRHSFAEQDRESCEKLESISQRVGKIESNMKPLGKTVATMDDRCGLRGESMEDYRCLRSGQQHHHDARMGHFAVRREGRCVGRVSFPLMGFPRSCSEERRWESGQIWQIKR